MKKFSIFLAFSATVFLLSNCKKEAATPDPETPVENININVLNGLSTNVVQATYNDLAKQADQFSAAVQKFNSASSDANLEECRKLWKETRLAWEQSEGFLFGPVSTENIDPRIDTWPVNYTDLDSVLASNAVFSEAYIEGLEDALRGFHPIEYLIFGQNGAKTAAEVTARQKQYLVALTENLKKLTATVANRWNPSINDNYSEQFIKAGNGSTIYPTTRSVYEEVINAMAGICDEVGNGKIKEPYDAKNPSLEESPFAKNSIKDFTDNMTSVLNMYIGKYKTVDGFGVEDLVKENNLALDKNIKTKIAAAINALNKITLPFGEAITQQPQQIESAMKAINELKVVIEVDLMKYIQSTTN
jgi:predicted lipoprotein